MHSLVNSGFAPTNKSHEPVFRLEAALLHLPQVEMPVEHDFCSGIYARTIHIPAEAVLTGAIHRHECFFLVRSGELIVTTDEGSRRVGAGDMFVTPAGTKRAGIALTDVIVTTFHANPENERNPVLLWDQYVIPAPPVAIGAEQDFEVLS